MNSRLLLALLWTGALLAQSSSTTGTIQCSVADASGAAMPGVRVTAVEAGSRAAREVTTDETGRFRLAGLPIGEYNLRFDRDGFAPVLVPHVQVSVGQTVAQRIEMKPAQVVESFEVREQADSIDTEATASSAALGGERIEESPAQNRNYLNFVLVAPGVASSAGSNTQRAATSVRSAAPDSGFTFGGMRGRNNGLSIDGVDNRDETTGGNRVAVGLEMVQEFRVAGATLSAEFGGAAGGAVNVVTRSGTNVWHGDATFFGQNEKPNARNPEVRSGPKPRFRRHQPGTSLNGPLRPDRTFFSYAVEQEWESSEEWSETPAGALEAINRALRRPEFSGAGVRAAERGLFPARDAGTEFSFKLNHQLNRTHALSARYAFSRGRVRNDVQGLDNFSDRSARASSLTRDHSLVAAWTAAPKPHLVNDLRFQAARRSVAMTPNSGGAMLEIPGEVTLGGAWRLDGQRTEDHYEAVEGVNLVAGRHQFGFGASVHTVRLTSRLANRYTGVFVFPTLADFAAGRPDVFLQSFGDPRTRFSTTPVGLWVQDRWQAAKGLTVEAGLRYDFQKLPGPFASPTRNIAPRLGFAWQPGGKGPWVLRGGFGLFYDRYPLAYLDDAVQNPAVQYLTGADAVRALGAGSGGPLTAPLGGLLSGRFQADAGFPSTYSRKFTAGLERRLDKDTKLTVEYAAVRGFHLPRVRNIAGGLPPVYQLEQTAQSDYDGVSVSANRRLTGNVTFLAAYHASRTRDDASDYDEHPLDPRNLRLDWGPSRQHQAHRLAASALFELADEGPLKDVIVSPIFTAGSGRPLNALDTTDALRTGAYPLSARPFGLGRNPFLGPPAVSVDLRVMKGIWVVKPRRAVLQVGVEAFNLLNHSNPLRVSPYYAAGGRRLDSYRDAVETLNARQFQLVAQFEF